MEIFMTLEDAKVHGSRLARRGSFPTIYKHQSDEYIVITKGEWPPKESWPFLKWIGRALYGHEETEGWVPVLARLDTLQRAQDACGLFNLLGFDPIIVQFPGITFDIFLNEAHVPVGARIVLDTADEDLVVQLQTSRFYDEEEEDKEELRLPNHPI
jgi:hypothetical protein